MNKFILKARHPRLAIVDTPEEEVPMAWGSKCDGDCSLLVRLADPGVSPGHRRSPGEPSSNRWRHLHNRFDAAEDSERPVDTKMVTH
jgi:hypothetical protein